MKSNYYSHAGLEPFHFKVLVLPNKVNEKSKGGVIYADTVKSQMQTACCKGTLMAVSPLAFTYFDRSITWLQDGPTPYEQILENWPGTPKPGDLILFGKYSGSEIELEDGKMYRLMNDVDIIANVSKAISEREEEYID